MDDDEETQNYWLMKAEQEDRVSTILEEIFQPSRGLSETPCEKNLLPCNAPGSLRESGSIWQPDVGTGMTYFHPRAALDCCVLRLLASK